MIVDMDGNSFDSQQEVGLDAAFGGLSQEPSQIESIISYRPIANTSDFVQPKGRALRRRRLAIDEDDTIEKPVEKKADVDEKPLEEKTSSVSSFVNDMNSTFNISDYQDDDDDDESVDNDIANGTDNKVYEKDFVLGKTSTVGKPYLMRAGKTWSIKNSSVILSSGYINARLYFVISNIHEVDKYDFVVLNLSEYFELRKQLSEMLKSGPKIYVLGNADSVVDFKVQKNATVAIGKENVMIRSYHINGISRPASVSMNMTEFKEFDKALNYFWHGFCQLPRHADTNQYSNAMYMLMAQRILELMKDYDASSLDNAFSFRQKKFRSAFFYAYTLMGNFLFPSKQIVGKLVKEFAGDEKAKHIDWQNFYYQCLNQIEVLQAFTCHAHYQANAS